MGKKWKQWKILFSWAPKSLWVAIAVTKLRRLVLGGKTMTNLNRDITLSTKIHIVKAMVSPVVVYVWELYHKEGWALKNWCFQNVALEETLESPLDSKEIKPVNPRRNKPWTFVGRSDAEVLVLWPLDVRSWLTGKDPDAGKDWR